MKVANFVLAGLLATACGCANQRPYSAASPGGSSMPSAIPDTTPRLGEPAPPSGGSGGGATYYRGTGPSLKRPEAFRDDAAPRAPRLSSRWQSTFADPETSESRPGASASTISALEKPVLIDEPTWNRSDRSTDRRVIESMRLGSGSQRIAILGSLHGDETQSVALVDELARHLKSHPEALRSATVLLVKTPNPDGFEARSPYNVRGVDLNRNFPSPNWQTLRNSRAGSKPASEAETRVIVRLLEEFRPTLLVHLKDSRHETVINSEGDRRKQAERIAGLIRGQTVDGLGARTSGSVENYAETKLSCPSLTLLLALEANDRAAWTKNREALLTLLGGDKPVLSQTGTLDDQTHPFDRASLRKSSLPSPRPVDLTETRPSQPRSKLTNFPSAIPDHGYVELPPP